MGVARRALGPWFPIRHGFASRLKRPRAPDFGRPQNFGSKDNFQHFCKQLYLYYCFGLTHVFSLCRYSPVAKPQIFGEPCNTVRTKFFCSFHTSEVCSLRIWMMPLCHPWAIPPIRKLSCHYGKSFFRQYLSHYACYQNNFGVYPHVLRGKE